MENKSAKPILLLKFPLHSRPEMMIEDSKNVERKLEGEYYVLCLMTGVKHPEVELLSVTNVDETEWEDLRERVLGEIRRTGEEPRRSFIGKEHSEK